jgi:hypothetical protein
VLERGQEISKREWKLIRVAIVDIQNSTYIGRLFFGDRETGEVVWDCDCRPSDGMWLSFQVHVTPGWHLVLKCYSTEVSVDHTA